MRKLCVLLGAATALTCASVAEARAPDTFEEDFKPPIIIESPQWASWEMRVGPYQPSGSPFRESFDDDKGWLFATEVDITAYKIPYVGHLAVGLGFGWAAYDGEAPIVPGNDASGEKTKLTLYPLSTLAVLRVDALPRYTVVPITFAAKLGADYQRWKAETAGATDKSGLNVGFRWGLQAALELDFIDRRSARRLDEDFGINHTYLFVEMMEAKTKALADRTFSFGLGVQF